MIYCVKDKRKTPDIPGTLEQVVSKNGRLMERAKCAVCGIMKYKILGDAPNIKKNVSKTATLENKQVGGFSLRPRNGPSPSVREFLTRYGLGKIVSITVCRKPIRPAITKLLNLISLGSVSKEISKLGYDNLFHLYIFMTIELGGKPIRVRIEKDHVISMKVVDNNNDIAGGECILVPFDGDITLLHFISNGAKAQGNGFWLYDPINNNCQVFVINLLKGNNLLNNHLRVFILQDVKTLMHPFLEALSKKATDLAGITDKLIHGEGTYRERPKKGKIIDLKSHG